MTRSEIRLAKVEIRGELRRAISSSIWIAAGIVAAMSAWNFLLWTLAYALASRMSMWAATLIVAIVMTAVAVALAMVGIRQAKHINPIPERTLESVKENLEWMKQSTK
jgi:hypothetical protein